MPDVQAGKMLKLENEIRESLCSLCNNLNLRGGDPSLVSNRPICCQLCNVSKQNVFSTPVLVFLEMISNLSEAATSVPFDIERHFLWRRGFNVHNVKVHFSASRVGSDCIVKLDTSEGASRPLSPRSMTHTVQTYKYTRLAMGNNFTSQMTFQISFVHRTLFLLLFCSSRSHFHQNRSPVGRITLEVNICS